MLEGISPASGILHQTMVEILSDMLISIAIFTTFLIVCNSYDDCYKKTREIFLLYVLNEMLFYLVWLNPKSFTVF
jgi:hypothetical protein